MLKSYQKRVLFLMTVFSLSLFVFQLCGCSSTYQQARTAEFRVPPKLDVKSCSVYITTPSDGRYGTITYPNSGSMTARAIMSAFLKKVTRVESSPETETLEAGLKNARSQKFSYYVRPSILHWEERATEWSGQPDRIEVNIKLVRVDDGKTIDSVNIKGKSKLVTFGGDHPQDLLQEPINNYVSSLFE